MSLLSSIFRTGKKATAQIANDFDVLAVPAYVRYNIQINGVNQYNPAVLMVNGWGFRK